ncbi:MAG: hypothetical protein SXV54_16975 [Chloroflexota bacterium]|nr:hypothetical protein [Chloroflexota bacterium]
MIFHNFLGSMFYRVVTYVLVVTMTATSTIPVIRVLPRATAAYLGVMRQLSLLAPDLLQTILTAIGDDAVPIASG